MKLTYFIGNANGRGLIRIEDADTGEHIASLTRDQHARAKSLTHRYNCHDELVAALKQAAYDIAHPKENQDFSYLLTALYHAKAKE